MENKGRKAIKVASYLITVEFESQGHPMIVKGYSIKEALNFFQREELEDEEKDTIVQILMKGKALDANLKEIIKRDGKTQITLEFQTVEEMLKYMQ